MCKPILFISHSTNTLPDTDRSVKIKKCLEDALPEYGWNVFIDKDIRPGDKWRMEILHNLTEAQAGIILFNERAISQSTWVAAEALILSFRKSIDPNFQIIPVLLDGKGIDDTCFDQYEPFQLKEIQVIKDNPSRAPQEFVKDIIDCLDSSRAGLPPMSPWVHRVVSLLDKDKIEITYLQEAAERLKLSVECDLWNKPEINRRKCLCRTIVELMHYRHPLDYIGAINLLLRQLSGSSNDFRDCLTAKWVENKAMEIILYAFHNPGKFRILTINTRQQDIIDIYLKRAEIEIPDEDGTTRFFPVSGAAGEGDEAIEMQIDEAIKANIAPNPRLDDNGNELPPHQAAAKQLTKPGDFAICALPKEFAKERILKKLCQKYADARIVFLVPVGDQAEYLERFGHIGGVPLRPPLNNDKCDKLYDLKNRLMPKK